MSHLLPPSPTLTHPNPSSSTLTYPHSPSPTLTLVRYKWTFVFDLSSQLTITRGHVGWDRRHLVWPTHWDVDSEYVIVWCCGCRSGSAIQYVLKIYSPMHSWVQIGEANTYYIYLHLIIAFLLFFLFILFSFLVGFVFWSLVHIWMCVERFNASVFFFSFLPVMMRVLLHFFLYYYIFFEILIKGCATRLRYSDSMLVCFFFFSNIIVFFTCIVNTKMFSIIF